MTRIHLEEGRMAGTNSEVFGLLVINITNLLAKKPGKASEILSRKSKI